jgi:hypothetical protein
VGNDRGGNGAGIAQGEYGQCETLYTSEGRAYVGWKWNVPRINDLMRECVIYLYASKEDANTGSDYGGCGFLTYVKAAGNLDAHLYAVAPKHVIDGGFTVIRATTLARRKPVVLPPDQHHWKAHPDGDDLEICPIGRWRKSGLVAIPDDRFLTKALKETYQVGYGDDIYMAGRFMGFDGKQKNSPCLRFGNISMMHQPIERQDAPPQESFIVEMRSKSGFSGSPVFVYFRDGVQPAASQVGPQNDAGAVTAGPERDEEILTFLLGMDWGDIPLAEDIVRLDADLNEHPVKDLRARINSGMTAVVPAWRIFDFLHGDEFADQRHVADQQKMKTSRPPIPRVRET